MITYITLFLIIVSVLAVAYAMAVNRKSGPVAKWFMFVLASIFFWVVTNLIFRRLSASYAYIDALISYGAALSLGFSSVMLIRAMNDKEFSSKVEVVFYLSYAFVMLLSMLPGGIANGLGDDYSIITNSRSIIFTLFMAGYLIYTVGYSLYQSIVNNDSSLRNQYRIVFYGFLVSASLGLLFNLFLPTLFDNYKYTEIGPASAIFYMFSTFYAIFKHKLFDIKTSAFRAVGYTFTLLAVALITIVLSFKIFLPVMGLKGSVPAIVYIVAFVGIVFVSWAIPRFRKLFDRLTYKIFYRNSYNPVQFAEDIADVVTSNSEIGPLQKNILKLYNKAYSADYIQIVLNHAEDENPHQKHLSLGSSTGQGAPGEVLPFYERLFFHKHDNRHGQSVTLRAKLDFEEGSDEAKELEKNNIGMISKLKLNKRLVAFLVFGEKTSGTLYTLDDAALVNNHQSELGVALQNAVRYNRIKQFNLELQEKVDIATAKLKKSNARLRKLDKAKDDFLSIASHQLRTPLTVVRGNVSLVAEGTMGPVSEEAKEVLVQSERSAGRLADLINDFLSTSRLKTGKFVLDPQSINLRYIVEQQYEQLKDFATMRRIELILHKIPDDLPEIMADDSKIRQVILNTIDNAIYYSPRGKGKVEVMLYSDGKDLIYKVKDNGIGVPEAEKRKLFGRMYRADNAKGVRPDGNGLGLFLMKKIIDAHKGEIIFESKEGKGSTFGFRLSLHPDSNLQRTVIS